MNFLRGFSYNATCQLLFVGMGFANQVLLARNLTKEGYGNLAFWATTVMFGTLLLGEWLNRGNTYVVGRERVRDAAAGNALVYLLALALPVVGTGLLWWQSAVEWPLAWLLVAGLIVLNVAQKGGVGILLGEDRIRRYALVPVTFIATYLGGNLLVLWLFGLTLERVMVVWLVAMGAGGLLALSAYLIGFCRSPRVDLALFRRTLGIGSRGAISFILIFLLFRNPVWLIEHFLGEAALGTFKVVLNFADPMQRLPNLVGVVLLAKVVTGQDEKSELSLPVAQGILLFSLASALGLLVLGQWLIELIFGSTYLDAYAPLVWMLPGLVFSGFGSVLNTKLAGQGYPPVTVWAPAAALGLNVGLNICLIPELGLRGASLSTSISFAAWGLIVSTYYLHRSGTGWTGFLHPGAFACTIKRSLKR